MGGVGIGLMGASLSGLPRGLGWGGAGFSDKYGLLGFALGHAMPAMGNRPWASPLLVWIPLLARA